MRRTQVFAGEPLSATAARRFARETLAGCPQEVLDPVGLMVTELAANCIRHVNSHFEISIWRTGQEIRVEVTDDGGGTPQMQYPGPDEPSGRGLRIVDLLADRWSVTYNDNGKTVWFTVSCDDCACE